MSDTIRALHVYRTYFPDPQGGMQEAIRQVCLATQSFGISNQIFTLSPSPVPVEIERTEARVIRSRSWASPASCDIGGLDALRKFRKLTTESTVLHYLFPWPFADVLNTLARPSIPSVLTYVSDIVRQRWLARGYAPLMWQTLKQVKAIVANCPAYARTSPILSDPSIRDKVRVIPFGIVEESYPKEGDDSVFSRLGLGVGEPYFLFVGVLRYYKGLQYLIEAARQIKAQIVIAGQGPEDRSLQRLARESQTNNVVFAGQISDDEKVALLKRCRALILPSHLRSEAFGMALVEASLFGRPLISCEIGTGTSYVNAHGESGLVVPPGKSAELTDAMNTLLRDDSLAQGLGQGARLRYDKLFSGPALGRAYSDLFHELIV